MPTDLELAVLATYALVFSGYFGLPATALILLIRRRLATELPGERERSRHRRGRLYVPWRRWRRRAETVLAAYDRAAAATWDQVGPAAAGLMAGPTHPAVLA